eukprot:CAMPEP_0170803622 /NCGR_PEP_ID=MMETSP0733-20121128/30173_1 /TAXON_ID=186038 /ORGANISM="Fragilariopsis kerguelensis, Strain L26-C5" /LENGTH=175 /DNA_ID=CAMNT_0011157425 /DNA_START=100 /DNA_END=628 /DNA_ORIENTATION=+
MSTENTSLKIATQDEDSNSAQKMSIDKRSIYQNPFFIIASSLLALLVLVAVTSQSGDQYLTPAEYERQIGERVVAVNIFGNAVSRIRCSQGPNPAPGGVTPAGKSPDIAADMAIAEQFAAMIPPRQVTIAACVQTTAILLHIVTARMEVIALDVLLLQVKSPILVYNSMILKGSC